MWKLLFGQYRTVLGRLEIKIISEGLVKNKMDVRGEYYSTVYQSMDVNFSTKTLAYLLRETVPFMIL